MDIIPAYNIVDTETTGLNPLRDRIIEIAIISVENNVITQEYSTLINPRTRINSNITKITGITQERLNQSPLFEDIKSELQDILTGKVFVAHNARFDYAFIKNEFRRFDDDIILNTLCTVRLARKLFPELSSHSLDSLINNFNLSSDNRHRALSDTKILYNFLNSAMDKFGTKKINKAVESVRRKPTVPKYLTNNDLDDLPEEPGVYIFWADDLALYVGKSINIKDRVKSHFSGDHSSPKDLKISSQINSIETVTTAGELGALILESKLIKELSPLHNRMLRRNSEPVTIIRNTANKYNSAMISRDSLSMHNHNEILSVHKTLRRAKDFLHQVSNNYDLCPKLLDLENGEGPCFNYQLDKCSGACIDKEPAYKYNFRFLEAFGSVEVKKWPFEGTIAVIEESGIKSEAHIVRNWCYLGTIELQEGKQIHSSNKNFNYDMYKIIKRFVYKNKNLKILKLDEEKISADLNLPTDI